MTYEIVLVGSDGSATAELAVRRAVEITAQHSGRLVIVTAYKPRNDELAQRNTIPDDIRWAVTDVNQAEERVRNGLRIASEAGVTGTVTQAIAGSPADVLLAAANTFAADLIVVGSRGLTPGTHAPLGSVAASVAHHAPCDVMIVHTTN
jgi:nucleotide-binding universal stress UspA family protein